MIQRSTQGTTHGGISIFSPSLERLFHMRQHGGQQPQFIHRWVLREILSDGVIVQRGKRVIRLENVKGTGRAEVVFEDGSKDSADLVVGKSDSSISSTDTDRAGADGVGSLLRGQLYPTHAQFERLPYLNIQMKLSTSPTTLPKLDVHGINLLTGTANYSLLLVPFHPQQIPARDYSLLIAPSPTSTMPADVVSPPPSASISEEPGFLFAILTIQMFDGWEETTQWGWKNKIIELLEADEADNKLIRAFKQDILPGSIGSPWQVVRCDPDRPVPYDGARSV